MLTRLLKTDHGRTTTILRLVLGVVFFAHGAQKVLGWFGGYGWHGTMGYFTSLGIPAVLGALAILAEFLGSLGLLSGFLTRVAAFGILCNMIVAALLVHLPNGFFMNWGGIQKGEGFEYNILAGTLAVYLIIRGGGDASVDAYLTTGKVA
jgi:putative oxidoreductase